MSGKNPAAVALGKLGGKAGTGAAKVRATSFSSESAKAALKARWFKHKRSKTKARALRQNDQAQAQPPAARDERKERKP